MILVTLGTQKFEMNRLVEAVDKLALEIDEEIFIQKGNSTYVPQNCKYKDFVERNEFAKMIEKCSVLIAHAGVGSIMTGINANRPVIVVPRLAKYNEHVDDHQKQIAEAFASKKCVLYCKNLKKLPQMVEEARNFEFAPYEMKGGKIEDIIMSYISIFEKPDDGGKK
ncbi:MAG: PssE/Cps14G family polysaccharide biosynthesis glycosyltransferase [Agathobacter sp.]|nr:PssE/Cps14G family polysaccharide biosynthesis glycosyltransferase [Agathobacter sp.]